MSSAPTSVHEDHRHRYPRRRHGWHRAQHRRVVVESPRLVDPAGPEVEPALRADAAARSVDALEAVGLTPARRDLLEQGAALLEARLHVAANARHQLGLRDAWMPGVKGRLRVVLELELDHLRGLAAGELGGD